MFSVMPPYRRLPRLLPRVLLRNEGVTALEFALISPFLLLIIMGIIEFSLIMFVMATMESATVTTSRLGKTGYVTGGLSRQQMIINNMTARTTGLLDPNLITITTTVYSGFEDIGQPEPYTDSNSSGQYNIGEPYTDVNGNGAWDADMGVAGVGNAGDIVVYNISYPWSIITPPLKAIIGNTYTVTVRTVVKNEPFS